MTAPLVVRNSAQGKRARQRDMVLESSESNLFLKRNLRFFGAVNLHMFAVSYRIDPERPATACGYWRRKEWISSVLLSYQDAEVFPWCMPTLHRSPGGFWLGPVGRTALPQNGPRSYTPLNNAQHHVSRPTAETVHG